MSDDWKIFKGDVEPHDGLLKLPPAPPWRFSRPPAPLALPDDIDLDAERSRAEPFIASQSMIIAVNAALYLRRPLLLTGNPGTGKSTLIAKVAHELKLGPVLRWAINSRSTVRSGVYEYDAVGRLQAGMDNPPVEDYLTLGPLGTALLGDSWPRPLLIDEVDKSDLDFANDLLNVIEEGCYDIPELMRLGAKRSVVTVRDYMRREVEITRGKIVSTQFPFVVMTSNAERQFPAPFLRRCVRITIKPPIKDQLEEIVDSHMKSYADTLNATEVDELIDRFLQQRQETQDVATDQLLNAVFLTVAMDSEERDFSDEELETLRKNLLHRLTGPAG